MGGNVFETSDRLSNAVYTRLRDIILSIIGAEARVAYTVVDKKDHGDLDILVQGNPYKGFLEYVTNLLRTYQVTVQHSSTNDKTLSVLVGYEGGNYQVDFDFLGPSSLASLEFAVLWSSFGGLGNLVGPLVKNEGLRLRPHGLCFDIKEGQVLGNSQQRVLTSIVLSDCWEDVLSWFGISTTFLEDVHNVTHKDLYKAVTCSPKFHKGLYSRQGTNRKNWDRDRKRPIYNNMVEFIEGLPEKPFTRQIPPTSAIARFDKTEEVEDVCSWLLAKKTLEKRVVFPIPTPEQRSSYRDMKQYVLNRLSSLQLWVITPEALQKEVEILMTEWWKLRE